MLGVLIVLAALVLAGDGLLAVVVWLLVRGRTPERPSRGGAARSPERRGTDPLSEGFENLMRFTAGGKTGFEPEYGGELDGP